MNKTWTNSDHDYEDGDRIVVMLIKKEASPDWKSTEKSNENKYKAV